MKTLVITLILYITIIFQSHADLINNSYLEIKKTHDFFCNKIINNKLLNINNEWSLITRTKTRHSYINEQKKTKLSISLFYRSNIVEKLIFTFYSFFKHCKELLRLFFFFFCYICIFLE